MKFYSIIFCALLLVSCGASVAVDYDKKIDFSTYNSYDFYSSIDSGLSELDDKRIMQITDSLLQIKGMVRSDVPQLYINFFASENISASRNTLGIGIGSSGGNVGIGVSGGIPIGGRVVNQQLTLDFIDAQKDDLVWQAVAEGEMKERATPQQKEEYYISVLEKILKKYPPRKK